MILSWIPYIKLKLILVNNTFIFIFSSFPPFFFLFEKEKEFNHCFYHLPFYPLETQHILNITWQQRNIFSKIRTLNILLRIFLFINAFFSYGISSNIHRYFNNIFHEFKAPKKVITTGTFHVDFYNKFIKFWSISFFQLFFILSGLFPYLLPYIYICIYIVFDTGDQFYCDDFALLSDLTMSSIPHIIGEYPISYIYIYIYIYLLTPPLG